jgi:hypothetical protein
MRSSLAFVRDFWIGSRNERVLGTLYKRVMVGRKGVPVVNSIVLAVDRESRDAGTRCWICVD